MLRLVAYEYYRVRWSTVVRWSQGATVVGTRGPGTPRGAYLGQISVLLAPGGHLKGPQWAVFEQKAESWDGKRALQEASTNRQTSKFANPQRLSFERAADHYLMSTDEYLTHIPETVVVGVQCLPGATVLLATST